jgi:hypothetical protein
MDDEQPNIWFVFQRHCRVHSLWNVRHFHKTKYELGGSFLQDKLLMEICEAEWRKPGVRGHWAGSASHIREARDCRLLIQKGCDSLAIHLWRCEGTKMSRIITGILIGWNQVLDKLISLTSMSILLRTNSRGRYNWGLPLWSLLWAWDHNSSSLQF